MIVCPWCDEEVNPEEDALPIWSNGLKVKAHRECMLRSVMGGIGHLEDHNYWCLKMNDPDGGRTYRQSALDVDLWVRSRGSTF